MKKNGFISTSLIYTFFILFLLLMLFLLNSYSSNRFLLDRYKYDIKNTFAEESGADINVYFLVYNDFSQDYELEDNMPAYGYNYESDYSYCKNGAAISYENDNVVVAAKRKDFCYAYFTPIDRDIDLKIYIKESNDSDEVRVTKVPGLSYEFSVSDSTCTNDTAFVEFDSLTRKLSVVSEGKTKCKAVFVKKEKYVDLKYYIETSESLDDTVEFSGKIYKPTENNVVPGNNYKYIGYSCNPEVQTNIKYDNNQFIIESVDDNNCNLYYDGTDETVNIIIMQESNEGVSGYTTGKKYTRIYEIPESGYGYVGALCDISSAKVTFDDNVLKGESDKATTCYAYFNKYIEGVGINYYLQKSDKNYESVSIVPDIGYIYNSERSSCKNNSNLKVINNKVEVETFSDNEECDVYFDIALTDIQVLIYVDGKLTKDIPNTGKTLVVKSCTNGASIDYINDKLKVRAKGPTVCTVYFN